MTAHALESPRFIRKTQLAPGEYRKNFHQIDREIITAVTSEEADRVTPLMSKIYLRMANAPDRYWEREGVLRIEAEVREERLVKAWSVFCELVGVASATASKAVQWMHEQGIIGYFAGKNGVGLRIFLNRAASSVGVRQAQKPQKILSFPPASIEAGRASANEPVFKGSFAVLDDLDTDVNTRAPKNGAENQRSDKTFPEPAPPPSINRYSTPTLGERELVAASPHASDRITLDEMIVRLKEELEPAMHTAARNAAAREHERTREWLENRGLPKAARVAQHEAYNVLRKHGLVSETAKGSHAEVGRNHYAPPEAHPLSIDEVAELASICVAMLETKGQSIELTLSEMSAEAGGFLLPEDAGKVREHVNSLLSAGGNREGK